MDLLEMRVFLAKPGSALAIFAVFFLWAVTPALAQTPFQASGATVSLAVTGTTSRVAVPTDAYNSVIRVYNSGTVPVFVVCGDVTAVATVAAGLPLAPGSVEVLGCGKGYIAGISAGTAATLYLTPGAGI
jgi:hypothetical protein